MMPLIGVLFALGLLDLGDSQLPLHHRPSLNTAECSSSGVLVCWLPGVLNQPGGWQVSGGGEGSA